MVEVALNPQRNDYFRENQGISDFKLGNEYRIGGENESFGKVLISLRLQANCHFGSRRAPPDAGGFA